MILNFKDYLNIFNGFRKQISPCIFKTFMWGEMEKAYVTKMLTTGESG